MTEITATPKPNLDPIISQEITPPGAPPVPPEPVPDCSAWRYFVERWDVVGSKAEPYTVPVLVGYDTITHNVGGTIITYQMPKYVYTQVTRLEFTYEWIAEEFNGCGRKVATHRSGAKHTTSAAYSDANITSALVAGAAQEMQIKAWNEALLDRANKAGLTAIQSSPTTGTITAGAFTSAREGLQVVQANIEAAMRDYAYNLDLYNAELESHQQSAAAYEAQQKAKQQYNDQMEVVSNMIREDKVGTAYTVKGAGNKTVSLTVGQEISGAQLISSGIQSTGSGFAIDPNTTYIITDVELSRSTPRINVPGLTGTSYPGKITITR